MMDYVCFYAIHKNTVSIDAGSCNMASQQGEIMPVQHKQRGGLWNSVLATVLTVMTVGRLLGLANARVPTICMS